MINVAMDVQLALPGNKGHYPHQSVVDIVVIMVLQVEVMVAPQMIYLELGKIAPLPQRLEENVYVTDIHKNMINLSRA